MLLIAFALTLIAIVAGMKLLAQTKKDNLGNLFKYVSWFVIIAGFLSILFIGVCHIKLHFMHKEQMMKERYMNDDDGYYGRGRMDGCNRMDMMHCHHMMGGCCDGMMMHSGGCCNMDDGCSDGDKCDKSSDCGKDMGSNCHKVDDDGGCPMMKGAHCMDKDSTAKKK